MTATAPLDLTVHSSTGLYDASAEHDACGVGMVTTVDKRERRDVVTNAIQVLLNLDHRGAVGAEENTGDGAGILMAMPDEFIRSAFALMLQVLLSSIEILKFVLNSR